MLKQKSPEYRGYRNPGIRLREEMLPQLKQLYGAHTREMLPAVHAFDKAHTVMLAVDGVPLADPTRAQAAQTADLEVVLEGGTTITGRAQFELPDAHRRLLDFLNASADPFFAVTEGTTTNYVNRAHVLYARPTS